MVREYLSVEEASKIIVGEILQGGSSKNWVGHPDIARELETHLAKFNIGYTDPKTGSWAHRRNGTRYFVTLKMMNVAKSKVNSFIASLKK